MRSGHRGVPRGHTGRDDPLPPDVFGLELAVAANGTLAQNLGSVGTADRLARKQTPAPLGKSYPLLDKIAVALGMAAVAICVGVLIYLFAANHHKVRKPRLNAPVERMHASRWIPPQGLVLSRISWDHYRADDGKVVVTEDCLEPAEQVAAILQYDPDDPDADDVLSSPSGDTCRVVSIGALSDVAECEPARWARGAAGLRAGGGSLRSTFRAFSIFRASSACAMRSNIG